MKGFIIAEAGVNHNGDLELARKLVDTAARIGADAIKFQTFKAGSVASVNAPKADYQKQLTDQSESQFQMLERLELPYDWHQELKTRAENLGLKFLSTAFDEDSLDFLVDKIGIDTLKIPSGELTNGPLILAAARTGLDLIISTGMANLDEIEQALGIVAFSCSKSTEMPSLTAFRSAYACSENRQTLKNKVTLLQCTTEYPASPDQANLKAMETMANTFDIPVGFSDHTPGIGVAVAAAARGATIIEKHFTLDRNLPGPDHAASLEPDEMADMIENVHMAWQAIGDEHKQTMPEEIKNKLIARRSLVAARPLKKGHIIQPDDLLARRPGTGVSPMMYWSFLDKPIEQDYELGELIYPTTKTDSDPSIN